jgi:putative phosphoserine phosphatase/1-acylglycerol-3-phosphate O-acyltransferase
MIGRVPALEELIASVHAAPPGRGVAACFDYDGTIIAGYSAGAFYRDRLRSLGVGPSELARTAALASRGVNSEAAFGDLLALSLQAWRGREEEELAELGRRLFKNDIASHLHHEVWRLVEAHQRMGHTIVLASSATRFQVQPMADAIGAHHVICTEVEVDDGRLTGRTAGTPAWGPRKARALRELAGEEELDLDASFAYSNGEEDVPLLTSVGHAVAVEPERGLAAEAQRRSWPVLRAHESGGRPGPVDVARTVAMYGGLAGAAGAGLGLSLVRRSSDGLMDVMGGLGSDIGLTLAGVDVDVVEGAEHLWSARPCVFVFNHQSKVDPVVVMKLVRRDFTAVGKAEAKRIPLFGAVFQLAGVAFVERGNTKQARAVLEPAVAKIRDERLSLMIAPEGTRSPTPKLGPFKKGAFHIAQQAGVPVVPIVIRNAGEIMWRGAQTLRPGRIEVVVLPPVPTDAWTAETMGEHAETVREMFLATLSCWPGDADPPEGVRTSP